MSSRTKSRPKNKGPKGYDTKMIRDFLDHLLWELRVSHAEHTTLIDRVNPELADQLKACAMRRQTAGLLPAHAVRPDPLGEITEQEAADAMHRRMATDRQKQIDALESLMPVFNTAMKRADKPNELMVISMNARVMLNHYTQHGDNDSTAR